MSRASAQRLERIAAEQELRQLAEPVRRQAAADALAADERHRIRLAPHLGERLCGRFEVELGDEPQAAHQAQRIFRKARVGDGPEHARVEIPAAAEGIDERFVGQAPRHRVDREVTPCEVVLDRGLRIDDDLEVVASRPRRDLAARRRELDPGGHLATEGTVGRMEAHAHRTPCDGERLGAAVRSERGAEAGDVDAGNEEVGVLRVDPEELVRTAPPTT